MAERDGDGEGLDIGALAEEIDKNSRPWQGYWAWRTKAVGECAAAEIVLKASGHQVSALAPGADPPDCVAFVDGAFCAIEVTELVHHETLTRSIKARNLRKSGGEPEAPEAYFRWDEAQFLAKIQEIIDSKEVKIRKKVSSSPGNAYSRFYLVIVTDEFSLDENSVMNWTKEATFKTTLITDVLLGLSYRPDPQGGDGRHPVFKLDTRKNQHF